MADLEKMFKQMMEKVEALSTELAGERQNRQALEARIAQTENALPDLASDIEEIARRNAIAESTHVDPELKDFSGFKEGSIRKEKPEKLPFTGKRDCCPYCTEHGKKSMLDFTKSGRWQCRMCGKNWYEEALGQKYSKKLEQYIREGDGKDPWEKQLEQVDAEKQTAEVESLKAELAELKMLIIKGGLANGSKVA